LNIVPYSAYEELKGADDDARIRYRSPRFRAVDLFPMHSPAVSMANHEYQLHDLSMTGMAVLGANDNSIDVGMSAPLRLRYGERTLFVGKGRVVRHQPVNSGTILGIHLEGDYLNIANLREQHRRHLISYALGPNRQRNWRLVPADFRRACADALDLVRSAKPLLEDTPHLDAVEERALLDMVEGELTPPWMALCHEIDLMLAAVADDEEVFDAIKRYTERVVTPEFLAGPIWDRAYHKPLGYPGDFGVMDYVYDTADAGETIYAKLLHRLGRASLLCVETRKAMMCETLKTTLADSSKKDPLRVLSIGAGVSEEVRQALFTQVRRPATFTLLDQDDRALNVSFERLYPETLRQQGQVAINCLQTGFQRLVNPRSITPAIPPQDIIYSLGILDYLKQPRAKRFCRTLYSLLKPGGLFVVANVQDLIDNGRWRAECIADWTLIYRTREQMIDLARDLGGEFELREDTTRNILMLSVGKPLLRLPSSSPWRRAAGCCHPQKSGRPGTSP